MGALAMFVFVAIMLWAAQSELNANMKEKDKNGK